ncbi:MAG: CinA family protein [Ignavibacteriales bacterium]|nr:MAG: CinA family protein [Ignavibacteriales bacterium]
MDYKKLESFLNKLKADGLTLAFAESMTAGMLVNEFSKINGASEVLKGSLVTYHPELKIQLLDVDPVIIDKYTPESKEVTTEMVKGLLKVIPSDIAVAVTGLASEGGSESPEKPVGTVFISILYKNSLHEFRHVFEYDDKKEKAEKENEIMRKTVDYVFEKLKVIYEGDEKT